jgi:hypothetical protein
MLVPPGRKTDVPSTTTVSPPLGTRFGTESVIGGCIRKPSLITAWRYRSFLTSLSGMTPGFAVTFVLDSKTAVLSAVDGQTIRLWDAATDVQKQSRQTDEAAPPPLPSPPTLLYFHHVDQGLLFLALLFPVCLLPHHHC